MPLFVLKSDGKNIANLLLEEKLLGSYSQESLPLLLLEQTKMHEHFLLVCYPPFQDTAESSQQ